MIQRSLIQKDEFQEFSKNFWKHYASCVGTPAQKLQSALEAMGMLYVVEPICVNQWYSIERLKSMHENKLIPVNRKFVLRKKDDYAIYRYDENDINHKTYLEDSVKGYTEFMLLP